jgi:hypothetical protein
MRTISLWVAPLAGPLTLFVGLSLLGAPALAAPAATPAQEPATTLRAAAASAAVRVVAAAPPTPRLQATASPSPSDNKHTSFFKTGRGVVVLALMAGTCAWVIYSAQHDRVRSPIN